MDPFKDTTMSVGESPRGAIDFVPSRRARELRRDAGVLRHQRTARALATRIAEDALRAEVYLDGPSTAATTSG